MKLSGLSARLALLMVVATLVMQLGHGLYRFSVDVPKANQHGIENVNKLVESLQPALAEALYQYNETLSDKLLKAFKADDAIQTVWLLDHDGTGVGVWIRDDMQPSDEQYEVTWPLVYDGEEIGSLVVLTDMAVVKNAAMLQVWSVIGFSILIGLLALLFLYVIAQFMVTKPIKALSNMVEVIETNAFTEEDVTALDNITASGEIEILRVSVKHILLELAQHLGENRQSMMILKEFNQSLEGKVLDRTLELEAAKEKAEVANRAKTDFLNVITHELRTPLNGVLGFSGILKKRDLAEKDKQLVIGIEQAGNGLLVLLTDIIDFVDLENKSLTCHSFSVYDALIAVFNDQKKKAHSKGLECLIDIDTSLVLKGDPKRLAILTRQLLANGIKFTHSGSVALQCHKEEDGQILLSVVDTGIGLDDAHYGEFSQEVFTQVEQGLNRSSEGIGLGLAIANRICSKWPATLWFEKNEPQGTKVCVRLSDIEEHS
ncbi:MAG: signal transduction histidine kinase [Bermanella sp.]|jgi:signal transduction histidine kinase